MKKNMILTVESWLQPKAFLLQEKVWTEKVISSL